jgi:uncharacterized protein
MYASTGDERLKENAARGGVGFAQCQEKLGTGYLHTQRGNFTSRGEAPLGLWYGIHKFLAGLFDVYVYCDNAQALGIARKLGDWAKAGADELGDEQMQKMLAVEVPRQSGFGIPGRIEGLCGPGQRLEPRRRRFPGRGRTRAGGFP